MFDATEFQVFHFCRDLHNPDLILEFKASVLCELMYQRFAHYDTEHYRVCPYLFVYSIMVYVTGHQSREEIIREWWSTYFVHIGKVILDTKGKRIWLMRIDEWSDCLLNGIIVWNKQYLFRFIRGTPKPYHPFFICSSIMSLVWGIRCSFELRKLFPSYRICYEKHILNVYSTFSFLSSSGKTPWHWDWDRRSKTISASARTNLL